MTTPPDDTTAPVTAEDLPARMADAIGAAARRCDDTCGEDCTHIAVTAEHDDGRIVYVEASLDALAAVAMSVRWEHAASQAAEVERLRAELAETREDLQARIDDHTMTAAFTGERLGYNQPIPCITSIGCAQALAAELDEVVAERDALKAAIEELSARHQPKTAQSAQSCGEHGSLKGAFWIAGDCPNCRVTTTTVCSNLTCCEYPCEDRRAIDAALAVPETTPDAPTGGNSKEILSTSDAPTEETDE